MHNDIWTRDEIESPCVRICLVHREIGLCVGCLRSPGEIAAWSTMDPAERRRIIEELPARKPLLRGTRKGRAARLSGSET
jgi:uncharacterized protein